MKKADESADMPTADHPFFWAGYMLVDTGPRQDIEPAKAAVKAVKVEPSQAGAAKDGDAKPDNAKDVGLPPPEKAADGGNVKPETPDRPKEDAVGEVPKDAGEAAPGEVKPPTNEPDDNPLPPPDAK